MAALAALVAMLADGAPTRPPLEPVLRIRETTEYYDVFARNEAELLQRLQSGIDAAPHAHGLTEGVFSIERRLTQRKAGCVVEAVSIDLSLRMVLPRWQGGQRVPRQLRDQWDRLSNRIRRHEERHRENVIRAARSMRDEIAGLPVQARCDQADAAMKRVIDSAEMKRRFADEFVDQRRVLPLSLREGR